MQAQDQLPSLQDTIERIYGDPQVQLGIGAPTRETGTVAPGTAKVRVRHNLKPWELSANATLLYFYVGSTLLLSFLCVTCAILAPLCFLFFVQ